MKRKRIAYRKDDNTFLAITVLSGLPTNELVAAIRGSDLSRLAPIPGVGEKVSKLVALPSIDHQNKI